MENKSSFKEIIDNSMEQIRTIVDANTVLGNPISTPSGTTIIPVSKLSIGFASGGVDMPTKGDKGKNFGGGGGTGVTLIPLAIITVSPEGAVEMISMNPEKATPIEQVADILDNAPSVIARIKDVIVSATPDKKEDDEDDEALGEEFDVTLEDKVIEHLTEKELKQIQKIQARAAKRAAKELLED